MKSILILISFCVFSVGISTTNAQMRYGQYAHQGQTSYIIETTDVKAKPLADSKPIARLAVGKKVTVQGVSKTEHTRNGYTANWYEIRFSQYGKFIAGYVWGGALSAISLPFPSKLGTDVFLYGLTEFNPEMGFMAVAKVIRNGKEIAQVEMPAISFSEDGRYEYCLKGKVIGKRGFSNLNSIFEIASTYAACGYPNVNSLIFWNGHELKFGTQGVRMTEAGYGSINTELIFPDEIGGKPNHLMLIETHKEYAQDIVVSRKVVRKELHWNGQELRE